MTVDACDVARQYINDNFPGRSLTLAASRCPDLDDGFCARVAAKYEALPHEPLDPEVRAAYVQFREETRAQFAAMTAAGVTVRPWTRSGQPYSGAIDMWSSLERTGVLYVYRTTAGHGPGRHLDHRNPLLAESDVEIDGVRLLHNDLLRAVHDFLGHSLGRDDFGLRGELRAAYHHLQCYSRDVHPALLTEFVAQICWFYAGSHLIDDEGVLPRRGHRGWLPPTRRPYPEQKVTLFPMSFVEDFLSRFATADNVLVGATS